MRKTTLTLLVAAASALATLTSTSAAEPPPQACPGELISPAVHVFGGRRAVAETFFGDYPKAVQDAQSFMKLCDVGAN
jgi:hypothetical protein